MSDLISREDVDKAIRSICNLCGEEKKNNGVMCGACNLDSFIREYDDIPSVEPERMKGRWLPHPHEREWDVCSVCGTGCKRREYEMQFGQERFTEYGYQYCPNCGADMRGDNE